jgi:hypothetical protein
VYDFASTAIKLPTPPPEKPEEKMFATWCGTPFLLVGAFLTSLVIGGCSLALAQPAVIAGKWFPEAELGRIRHGGSVADIQRVGGTPLETISVTNGEQWRYYMSLEQKERVRLLGVVPLPSRNHVRTFETIFSIRGGVATDVRSYDSERAHSK